MEFFMLDRRYKYSLRLTSPFYIFRKNRRSDIFYVRFKSGKTVSTRKTNIQEAYEFALNYKEQNSKATEKTAETLQAVIRGYYEKGSKWVKYDEIHGSKYTDSALRQNRFACEKMAVLLDDVKDFQKLTKARLHKLQEQLLSGGLSGKTVNNYICILHKIFKQLVDKEIVENDPFAGLRNCAYEKQRRMCFPIEKFKGYFGKPENLDGYDLAAYCAIVTGARRTELKNITLSDIEKYNGIHILRIHGTKSEYSDRTVPLGATQKKAVELLIKRKVMQASTVPNHCAEVIGARLGFSLEEVRADGICFHSFRKMYKTILTTANLNTSLVETLMGHSTCNQSTNDVERIYFVADRADMSEVYSKVADSFGFMLKHNV